LAGLDLLTLFLMQGKVTSELLGSIRLTRYQGCKATVPFADYVAGRKRQGMWHWG
jgi:hypothetical protein